MLIVLWLMALGVMAQPRYRLMTYDDFNGSASQVSRIVRDGHGMVWFSTSDGLYRYDGYDFRNFKSHSGDGVNMPSNNISSMYTSSEGSIWCIVGGRVFLFDTRTYYYIDVMADYEQQHGQTYRISKVRSLPCGTTWLFAEDGNMFALNDARPLSSIKLMAEHVNKDGLTVVCDQRGRSWVLTDQYTYLYHDGQLKRFDQTFHRVISSSQKVWLVAADGQMCVLDEVKQQLYPWTHPLLTAPITGHAGLADKNIVLCTQSGLLLLSPDGRKLLPTAVTWPVRKVIQDKSGRLWLLGMDGRLSTADKSCRQVKEIQGVRMDDFNMHADKYGTLWFFAGNGDTYYASIDDPGRLYPYDQGERVGKIQNTIYDEQGGCWFLRKGQVCRLTFESRHTKSLPLHSPDQVRGLVVDRQQRLLVGTRYDEAVTVFSKSGERLGWLGRDGRISPVYQSFGAAVYNGYRSPDGTLWLGTKRDGVFRLRSREDGSYEIAQFVKDAQNPHSISDNEVYGFATDQHGRLWVATRHGGLCCVPDPQAAMPSFVHAGNGLAGWKVSRDVGVSSLLPLSSGLLLVGTYGGLYVADISGQDLKSVVFKHHQREARRMESLSSSDITGIVQVKDGRIFLSTGDGGINEILTHDLKADQLNFRHYDLSTGFPADITKAMAEYEGSLWVTTTNRLIEMRLGESKLPDVNTFLMQETPHFSAAKPVQLDRDQWVFGADEGALLIDLKQLKANSFTPPLIVTGVSKEGGPVNYAAGWSDTICLSSKERDLTIWFSALDYEDTRHVVYAYKMDGGKTRWRSGGKAWNYLGQNHSIALSQMQPGTYHMTLRSTNSDGVWCNNERQLTIIVTPTFWETPWALLLIVLTVAAVTALVLYTTLYIRRLKRQQRETLEKYLALVGQPYAEQETVATPAAPVAASEPEEVDVSEADDELMKRLVSYVESSLGNSDVSIDDIAAACAVSRTSLHRKVKSMLGTSPMEFMREARIRKATQLLTHTNKPVSEIAYECGFTDPKYFSKCFKAATGKSPTEYKLEPANQAR